MKKFILGSSLLVLLALLISSCQKDIQVFEKNIKLNLPDQTLDYVSAEWEDSKSGLAAHASSILATTGISNEAATLGRVLFYDTQLSLNNRISCASCHDQKRAFADKAKGSVGFENKVTPRNSMAIVNPILNNSLFWDSRAQSIENLVREPIQNHIEMGMESMDQLSTKLANVDYYKPLFSDAFGNEEVNGDRITQALGQFLRSMVSLESRFDEGLKSDFSNFSAQEMRGQEIFFSAEAKCSTCHGGANFSAPDGNPISARINLAAVNNRFSNSHEIVNEYAGPALMGTANIGLDVVYSDDGFGRGQFKIPTLRNIALTGPYMHDGRYSTLEEVVEHYSSKIKLHENLDDKFIEAGQVKTLNLNDDDKASLVAFLKTLTDEDFIAAERFSDPFVR